VSASWSSRISWDFPRNIFSSFMICTSSEKGGGGEGGERKERGMISCEREERREWDRKVCVVVL
jgi:hypothetical protein